MRRIFSVSGVLLGILGAMLTLPVAAGNPLFGDSIPFGAGSGDGSAGSVSQPLALSNTALLVGAEGADGVMTTADDLVLLMTAVNTASPAVTPFSTPGLSDYSGRLERLSATRALAFGAGVDEDFGTADDAVYVLDRLGSGNQITTLEVGGLRESDGCAPAALSSDLAVVSTGGPDGTFKTADDTVLLLTDLGGTPAFQALAAPFLDNSGRSRPVRLSPTSFLLASNGPNGTSRNADDVVYLFTDVGGANTRVSLATPQLIPRGSSLPVRVTATRALVTSCGPDAAETTLDDRVFLLDDLGGANTVTPIPIPSISDFGGGRPQPLTGTLAVVSTQGPDSSKETDDDTVAVITDLGGANTVTHVTVGNFDEDLEARCAPLSADRCALTTAGPDHSYETADDELVVISDVGGANTVTRIAIPGLTQSVSSAAVPLSTDALLLSDGGADLQMSTGEDDRITFVRGIPGSPALFSVLAAKEFGSQYGASAQPVPLGGGGSAACVTSGDDADVGEGDDDVVRIVGGMDAPNLRALSLQKAAIKMKNGDPNKVTGVNASGAIDLDEPELLAGADITVSLGNSSQAIPAALIKRKQGSKFEYADKKGRRGWVKSLKIDTAKGTFSVSGSGKNTGAGSTAASYLVFALEAGDLFLADTVAAQLTNKGIQF